MAVVTEGPTGLGLRKVKILLLSGSSRRWRRKKAKASRVEFAKEREYPTECPGVEFGKEESAMKLQERVGRKSGRTSATKPNSRASTSNKK